MRSRTSIALYVGLLFFVAGLGFTCYSVYLTNGALDELHRFKTQFAGDNDQRRYARAYAQFNARLSAGLAFFILLTVAFASWLAAMTAFLIMLRRSRDDGTRRTRLLRTFSIAFCSIAVALAVFGAIVFAILGSESVGFIYGFNIITLVVWLACMILAIATCIVVFVDRRDANRAAMQSGGSGGEMTEAGRGVDSRAQ